MFVVFSFRFFGSIYVVAQSFPLSFAVSFLLKQENFRKVAVIADFLCFSFFFSSFLCSQIANEGKKKGTRISQEIINDIFKCMPNVVSSRFPLFSTITFIVDVVSFFAIPVRKSHKFILKRYQLRMIEEIAVTAKIHYGAHIYYR